MDLLYAVYNRHRLPAFQIETAIWRDAGRTVVHKTALTPEAAAHVRALHAHTERLRGCLRGPRIRLPETALRGEGVLEIAFVPGRRVDDLLAEAARQRRADRLEAIVSDYLEALRESFPLQPQPVWHPDMARVFGMSDAASLQGLGPFLTPALADPIFENLIAADDGGYVLIDAEWVFEGCLPLAFILARSVFYFYEKQSGSGLETWLPRAELWKRLAAAGRAPAGPDILDRFTAMEDAFQSYVFGTNRCFRATEAYARLRYSVPALSEAIGRLQKAAEHWQANVRETEDKAALWQRRFEDIESSRGWQLVQRAGRLLDRGFPPQTRRRRLVDGALRRCLPGGL